MEEDEEDMYEMEYMYRMGMHPRMMHYRREREMEREMERRGTNLMQSAAARHYRDELEAEMYMRRRRTMLAKQEPKVPKVPLEERKKMFEAQRVPGESFVQG
jgi:DNA primase large subunit